MSSIFSISSVTDAGIAAMQEALDHGYTMTFTAMKTGNGIYTTGEDVTGRTALKSLKNTYTIGSIEEDTDGATVSAVFANYDGVNILVAEDYKINEIGLFCTVNGIEYLYALAAVPNDDGMEMPAYDIVAENLVQFIQEWYVENSNNASITVDPAGAYIPVTDIVDNLTSTSTTKPLSANQGKALNDTKQPKTLSIPITIGGTSQTTVEGALGGLNTVKAERADITSIICTGATNDTGATITEGTYFYLNNVLCKALASIADGATFTLNTNYKEVTAGEELTELNSNLSNLSMLNYTLQRGSSLEDGLRSLRSSMQIGKVCVAQIEQQGVLNWFGVAYRPFDTRIIYLYTILNGTDNAHSIIVDN